jgi:hypothetical protein
MIILGIVLPFLGISVPRVLTTVVYAEPIRMIAVNGYDITSGTQSNPVHIPYKSTSTILVTGCSDSGKVVVTVNPGGTSISLSKQYDEYGDVYWYWSGSGFASGSYSFTVTPEYGSSKTVYAVVDVSAPETEAYLNGQKVLPSATVVVTNPSLQFYVVVKNSYYVSKFHFEVKDASGKVLWSRDEDVGKNGPVTSQTYSYTLPSYGKYQVTGEVYGHLGEKFTAMSITLPFGQEFKLDLGEYLNLLTLLGIICFAIGSLQKRRW